MVSVQFPFLVTPPSPWNRRPVPLYDGLDILWMFPLRMDYYRRRRQIPALCLGRRRANLKKKSAG